MIDLWEQLKAKIGNMLFKAILTSDAKLKTDNKTIQTVAVNFIGLPISGIKRPQNYGFYSNPMKGSQSFVAFPDGNTEDGVCLIAAHNEYAPTVDELPKGGCGVFHYKGHVLKFTNESLEITMNDSKPINIKAKNINIDLEPGGQFSVEGTHLTVDA